MQLNKQVVWYAEHAYLFLSLQIHNKTIDDTL